MKGKEKGYFQRIGRRERSR